MRRALLIVPLLASGCAARRTRCRHLVLLKSPYAGSTWFTDELTKISGVHLIAQLFAGKDAGASSEAVREKMANVLRAPCARAQSVAGFTQNPTHSIVANLTGFDWRFLREAKDVFFATWTRGNVVHRTFSQLSFDQSCHEHNTRSAAAQARCQSATYAVDRGELLRELWKAACERAHILALGEALARPGRAHDMLYEDFVGDDGGVLRELLRFLDLPTTDVDARRHSTILKRSAQNVSSMLQNAGDVVGWLRGWNASLVDMLLDTTGARFDATPRHLCDQLSEVQLREGARDDATQARLRALDAQLAVATAAPHAPPPGVRRASKH